MTTRDALGDRMKTYEAATRHVLPRRCYTILRLDGRAFHTLLRHAVRPFDAEFAGAMDELAAFMCGEVAGSVFGYVQSDEISILMQDFESTGTQPWFGGVIQKIVSVAAAEATRAFTLAAGGTFDARVFTLADPIEVANYFIWRQKDAVRNSVSMAAQAVFPHKSLHGMNGGQLQEKLFTEANINWNDYPDGFKRGRITLKEAYEQPTTTGAVERTRWVTYPAPHFSCTPEGALAYLIPPLPTFAEGTR
jgi:tRNA(His) 5'-end guanylyltransferase